MMMGFVVAGLQQPAAGSKEQIRLMNPFDDTTSSTQHFTGESFSLGKFPERDEGSAASSVFGCCLSSLELCRVKIVHTQHNSG